MSEELDGLDPALEVLEQQLASRQSTKKQDAEEDIEEASDDVDVDDIDPVEYLEAASEVLRSSAILLEFLSDPTFCKAITERDRKNINKQLEKMWASVDKLDVAVNALTEEEDEDEDV